MNAHLPSSIVLRNAAGLSVELTRHGALRQLQFGTLMLNLFPGSEAEGGPANLWLRLRATDGGWSFVPLLGARSPLRGGATDDRYEATGRWQGLALRLSLQLADEVAAWFWHLQVRNDSGLAQTIDLVHAQDLGLAARGAIRMNEYYVSQYVDLTPLEHARHGWMVAARQNQAQSGGTHPWALVGSLGRGIGFATDALQLLGTGARAGLAPTGLVQGLPSRRLQHEHAMAAIQEAPRSLAPGSEADFGFFGVVVADHPEATSVSDLARVDALLALAAPPRPGPAGSAAGAAKSIDGAAGGRVASQAADEHAPSLFDRSELLVADDLTEADIEALLPGPRRHEEREDGALLSFFRGDAAHVVLREKELRVHRPHGHILRSGGHLVPDEASLTSTAWMAGVFHSMLTEGHVSINRFLSTDRGWLGQYRARGLRLFVRRGGGAWQQLGVPSAFEIEPDGCRWLYRDAAGLLEVRASTSAGEHAMDLRLRVLEGDAVDLLATLHVALGGDDGDDRGAPLPALRVDANGAGGPERDGAGVFIGVPAGGDLSARFPEGGFHVAAAPSTRFDRLGGDELLYADGRSRGEPYVCLGTDATRAFGLRITGHLIGTPASSETSALALPRWQAPDDSAAAAATASLAEILPWYLHNALVHYLAPRGLEQYSGGGWGTRDVCQGPLEALLALDQPAPVRDLLLRVYAMQDATGDWPQWFMFFERERHIRAGDSHGDIVFWPLLGLARYLLASGDAALLDHPLPYYAANADDAEVGPVWQHVERALAVIAVRRVAGTHLAAYGHGDWNDSLQPADPALREHLCSAWTVTLHHQTLRSLARALRGVGREAAAQALEAEAQQVLADFQRLLVAGGTVAGYALFSPGQPRKLLLHPEDDTTGVQHSLLPLMHAVLDDMLDPGQAAAQLRLIEQHLSGPDGARLFDRPLPYRGGPQRLFQRAESSAFFGREIGVMYMHAHLRYAQMLAHLGEADRFFEALCKVHPVGLRERVLPASLRQANCYYSSSDAAFADRYEALRDYAKVSSGEVALDGGWRIYSSGPGIAISLFVGSFLGIRREGRDLVVDPVMPPALDGLRAQVPLSGRMLDLVYRVGPAGCGPTRLRLDGQALEFEREAHPYRAGAARVPLAPLLAALDAGKGRLEVTLG